MKLPPNEEHKTSEWILTDKRVVHGKGLGRNETKSYIATYMCRRCVNEYTRFVEEKDFKKLKIRESRWMWEWKK